MALSFLLLLLFRVLNVEGQERGVDPSKAGQYDLSKGFFQCHDKAEVIDRMYFNDDFCDCADGSDEPGKPDIPAILSLVLLGT